MFGLSKKLFFASCYSIEWFSMVTYKQHVNVYTEIYVHRIRLESRLRVAKQSSKACLNSLESPRNSPKESVISFTVLIADNLSEREI